MTRPPGVGAVEWASPPSHENTMLPLERRRRRLSTLPERVFVVLADCGAAALKGSGGAR